MANLDETQSKIVSMPINGKYQVIATPGSGKSRCLCERITHLVEKENVQPDRIVAITFTKQAAEVMKDRVNIDGVLCCTIHSLCYRILVAELKNLYQKLIPLKILTTPEEKKIIREVLNSPHIKSLPNIAKLDKDTLFKIILKKHGIQKNLLAFGNKLKIFYDKQWNRSEVANITDEDEIKFLMLSLYEKEKYNNGFIGFDDFCLYVLELFDTFPELVDKYKTKFSHVLLDEAQDTSMAQHQVIKHIVSDNLFMCGDPMQNIYGSFRGSDANLFVSMDKLYPDITVLSLQTNYRSATSIVNINNSIAEKMNWDQPEAISVSNDNGIITYKGYDGIFDESGSVGESILAETDFDNTAILFRTNFYSMPFELALRKKGIPFYLANKRSFFEIREVRNMLSYIKLSIDMDDSESFLDIYNSPNRWFGNAWLAMAERFLDTKKNVRELLHSDLVGRYNGNRKYKYWIKNQRSLYDDLMLLSGIEDPNEVIRYVRTAMGYDKWLLKEKSSRVDNDDEMGIYENIDALQSMIADTEDIDDILGYDIEQGETGVCLSTIHRAKGLEWKSVYLTGVNEKLLPHHMNTDPNEEVRLFYVAISRAIDKCYVSSSEEPSGFTDWIELTEDNQDGREQ